ncbi:MAG TPA: feruloyl-CoA synthase [Mycobacteriales bacterium]|nr:feruloyl-CoA synthase [Mycobacteriales bacterium]
MATFAEPRIGCSRSDDGTVRLWSQDPLGPAARTVADQFRQGSDAHPDRLLVAERDGDGWRQLTWGQARSLADRLAQGLLDRGLADRPVMILSGNSNEHLVLTLAAYTLGVPVVPVSTAYSLQSRDHAKLRAMVELVEPGLVFAAGSEFEPARAAVGAPATGLAELLADAAGPEVEERFAALTPDTVAKLLFTSGSTGTPKGVITTHGMLTANQQQIRQVWPFLADEPPVLLDWLPWSHTFGGSHDLGLVLANGGTMWIDDGRPVPALVGRTVANLADVSPTLYFNVPAGYAALLPLLERDPVAAKAFLARLRFAFFAAAALPQQLWDRLEALAAEHGATMRMTTSWGMTESSPGATTAHFAVTRSDCLGVPLPGVELKLVPVGRAAEVRLRGPNITPGYHRRPDLTAAAFDEEGYYRTGDAVSLVDEDRPELGLLFRGRLAEDFKLSTGTFVSVGTLRPALLSAAQGLLTDAVLCGHDTEQVTALAWLHPDAAGRCSDDGMPDAGLRAELAAALSRLAAAGGGSSQRVERLLLLTEPPALDAGEITDKGYINQRAVRERRTADVEALGGDDPRVVVRPTPPPR